jgi:O-antigen/teichoic acid export membrane protein
MLDKRFFINLLASVIAFVVNLGINFFLSPYIIDAVGVEAFGFIGLANNFITYASLFTIAINSMAGRFVAIKIHEDNLDGANKYFNSVLISNSVIVGIMFAPTILIILNLQKLIDIPDNILIDVQTLFSLIMLGFFVTQIGNAFSVATFVRNRLDISSIRRIEANCIKAILILGLFYFFEPSVSYIAIATLASSVFIFFYDIYYTRKLLPEITISRNFFDFKSIKEIFLSGIWNVFTHLSGIISMGLDLLIANIFVGATAMGHLSLSKTLPALILSLFGMLAGIFAPQLAALYAKKHFDKLEEQLILSIKFLGVFSSIPMAILFVYGDSFYSLWVPSQDPQLLHLLSIIACIEFIFVLPLEGIWNIFTVTNKVKVPAVFLFISSLISMTLVVIGVHSFNDPFIQLTIIAGISTFFGVVRALTFLPIYGAMCLKLKWSIFHPHIMKNVCATLILTLIAFSFKHFLLVDSWFLLIIVSIATVFIGLLVNSFLILNKNERNTLKIKISKELRS